MSTELERVYSLAGRTAVITGGASGIGEETSRILALAGARVVVADLDDGGAQSVVRRIEKAGGEALACRVDVRVRKDVDALVDTAVERFGGLDVMANVAGIMRESLVVDTDEAELDEILAVNLKGVFFGCAAAARTMAGRGGGSIINIASAAMDMSTPGIASYAMSKAAVAMLSRTLAVEMGADAVRVNTVAPGFIDTHMTQRNWVGEEGSIDTEARDALWSNMAGLTALSRIGSANDIALAILYLASDASSFMTGQVLRPNGGVVMP